MLGSSSAARFVSPAAMSYIGASVATAMAFSTGMR